MSSTTANAKKSPIVPLLIALAAVVALIVIVVRGQDEANSSSTPPTVSSEGQSPDETWEGLVRREPGDPLARGEVDAPVVMLSYSEFQCPFCGKFARDTEPLLVEEYVEDGTLRIEWRDFPYLGPESLVAATAGRAAAEQDMFWEFQEAMYADKLPPNSGRLDETYLASVAEGVGLDVDQFLEDMSSPAAERAVTQDFNEGQAVGITGTPAFLINGVPVIGAQPTEVFKAAIEKAAEEAGS